MQKTEKRAPARQDLAVAITIGDKVWLGAAPEFVRNSLLGITQ